MKTRGQILRDGTKDHGSAIYCVEQYKQGNCPMNAVEASIQSAMEEYANIKVANQFKPKADVKSKEEIQNDPFIQKHLAIIREKMIDNIIEYDIAKKMWGGLEMASIQHFVETGKINGSFYLRIKEAMLKAYKWNDSQEAIEYANQFKEKTFSLQDMLDYGKWMRDQLFKYEDGVPEVDYLKEKHGIDLNMIQ